MTTNDTVPPFGAGAIPPATRAALALSGDKQRRALANKIQQRIEQDRDVTVRGGMVTSVPCTFRY